MPIDVVEALRSIQQWNSLYALIALILGLLFLSVQFDTRMPALWRRPQPSYAPFTPQKRSITIRVDDIPPDSTDRLDDNLQAIVDLEPSLKELGTTIKHRSLAPRHKSMCATVVVTTRDKVNHIPSLISRAGEGHHPYTYSDSFEGITPLYDAQHGADVDIVAVPGLGSHPLGSWKSPKSDDVWLRDFLPQAIPNIRVLLYGYNTTLKGSNSKQSLEDIGLSLLEQLDGFRKRDKTSPRPVILIGHSLGGLVIKEALLWSLKRQSTPAKSALIDATFALLFFGVPNLGLRNEQLWTLVRGQPNAAFIRDLLVDSDSEPSSLMTKLSGQFSERCRGRFRVVTFFERHLSPTLKARIRYQYWSGGPSRRMQQPFETNHRNLVKFESKHQVQYGIVESHLQSLVYDAKVKFAASRASTNSEVTDDHPLLRALVVGSRSYQDVLREREKCLKSLAFAAMNARQQDIRSAHRSTCEWILKTEQFLKWWGRIDMHVYNGVLWVKGKAGVGKSTLMKHMFKHCCDTSQDRLVVSYFFNSRGSNAEKSLLGMLQSLVQQLIAKDDLLYKRFRPIFLQKQESYSEWDYGEEELKDLLLWVARNPQSKPIALFIDALDESIDDRRVMRFLDEVSASAGISINICLSSRYFPNLSMRKSLPLEVTHHKEHGVDIDQYIHDHLTKGDPAVAERMLQKANGVFLWVVLVLDMVNQAFDEGKIEAMHQKLDELPGDLEEIFETLLLKDNPDIQETVLLFQWLLFATDLLSPEELYYGMLAGVSPVEENLRSSASTSGHIRRRITHSSRGLIEVRKEQTSVQFIHQSVSDFLLRNKRLQRLDVALEPNPVGISHDRLTRCCLAQIDIARAKSPGMGSFFVESSYPFLRYAAESLLIHAEEAQVRGIDQRELLQHIQQSDHSSHAPTNAILSSSRLQWISGDDSLLLYVSRHAHHALFDLLLQDGSAEINTPVWGYGSVLHAAMDGGSMYIMSQLLKNGADAEGRSSNGVPVLQVACERGRLPAVELLLNYGASIDAQSKECVTALCAAILERDLAIVHLLLRWGADVNINCGYHCSALHAAVRNGLEDVAVLLLQHGAQIDSKDFLGMTELHWASYRGHAAIASQLLDHSADVEAQTKNGMRPLLLAARNGNQTLVQLLHARGAVLSASDNRAWGAVHHAVVGGHHNVIKLLLSWSSTLPGCDKQGRSLLHLAMYGGQVFSARDDRHERPQLNERSQRLRKYAFHIPGGQPEIVKLLLEHGADISALDHRGRSPLHAAVGGSSLAALEGLPPLFLDQALRCGVAITVSRGNSEIVKLLLERGAKLATKDKLGRTPLHAAAGGDGLAIVEGGVPLFGDQASLCYITVDVSGSNKEVLEVLLSYGAKAHIHDRDSQGRTPLHSAVAGGVLEVSRTGNLQLFADKASLCEIKVTMPRGDRDVLKLLLENGANLSLRDSQGRSPLHLAVHGGGLGISAGGRIQLFGDHAVDCHINFDVAGIGKEAVEWLLQNGADASEVDGEGRTPIHSALQRWGLPAPEPGDRRLQLFGNDPIDCHAIIDMGGGIQDAVQCLLDHGAELDASQRSALTAATSERSERREIPWDEGYAYLFGDRPRGCRTTVVR